MSIMPGYLKSSLTLAQARDTADNRFPESDSLIMREGNQPRFFSIKLTFLYNSRELQKSRCGNGTVPSIFRVW